MTIYELQKHFYFLGILICSNVCVCLCVCVLYTHVALQWMPAKVSLDSIKEVFPGNDKKCGLGIQPYCPDSHLELEPLFLLALLNMSSALRTVDGLLILLC